MKTISPPVGPGCFGGALFPLLFHLFLSFMNSGDRFQAVHSVCKGFSLVAVHWTERNGA